MGKKERGQKKRDKGREKGQRGEKERESGRKKEKMGKEAKIRKKLGM